MSRFEDIEKRLEREPASMERPDDSGDSREDVDLSKESFGPAAQKERETALSPDSETNLAPSDPDRGEGDAFSTVEADISSRSAARSGQARANDPGERDVDSRESAGKENAREMGAPETHSEPLGTTIDEQRRDER